MWHLLTAWGGIPLLMAWLPLYLLALTKGDPTDRACGHVLMIGAVLFLLPALNRGTFQHSWTIAVGQTVTDLLMLAALTAIAVNSSRHYPLLMAAAQLLIAVIGLLAITQLIMLEKTLAAMIGAAAILQVGAFVCGLIHHSAGRCRSSASAATAD